MNVCPHVCTEDTPAPPRQHECAIAPAQLDGPLTTYRAQSTSRSCTKSLKRRVTLHISARVHVLDVLLLKVVCADVCLMSWLEALTGIGGEGEGMEVMRTVEQY